jgi:glutamate-5-semialdehyde dehydrogenase
MNLKTLGRAARVASSILTVTSTRQKNDCLQAVSKTLRERSKDILRENAIYLEIGQNNGLASPLLDRLELTIDRVHSMADGLIEVAQLPDPVGEITGLCHNPPVSRLVG